MCASETWRKIDDWPYEVSNRGRVRRCEPGLASGRYRAHSATRVGKVLKAAQDRDGYWVVILCDRGRIKTAKIHILVCETFHGPKPSAKHQVCHLNGNNQDNRPANLRWGTAKGNAADRDRHGTTARGEKNPSAVLSQTQVDELRKLYRDELRQRRVAGFQRAQRGTLPKLAVRFNLNRNTLACILSGKGYN